MKYIIKILKIENITPDVKRFTTTKPKNFKFTPGQATHLSINKPKWKYEPRPFTFTSLNEQPNLEFTIKKYAKHKGVTNELHKLKAGDELIIKKPFGTIIYKGAGIFIAGGAGITPFIAILRQLSKQKKLNGNKLIFSNKTSKDIIIEEELKKIFSENPKNLILTLTKEKNQKYHNRFIDEKFLNETIKNFNQNFYICGPPKMTKDIKKILKKSGAKTNEITFEK